MDLAFVCWELDIKMCVERWEEFQLVKGAVKETEEWDGKSR